jgi:MarR family transcriptional regulator, organic hydroperoxide resistance regulator
MLRARRHASVPRAVPASAAAVDPGPGGKKGTRAKDLTGLFARVSDALLLPLNRELESSGLSVSDWHLLKSLRGDETGVDTIAERPARLPRPPIIRAIGRMVRSGLVRRCAPRADRCFSYAHLTRRGQGVVRRLAVLEARLERVANEALGTTASRELKDMLARFIRSVEKREKKTVPKRLLGDAGQK